MKMEKSDWVNKKLGLLLVAILSMSLVSATASGDAQKNSSKIIDNEPLDFLFLKISTFHPKTLSKLISE